MRLKGRDEHNRVALTVIYFLGTIALISTSFSGYLIHESVVSDNEITSASVALIGQMVSIATLGLGALGAMLSSTSPKPPPPPTFEGSTPVTVVNNADNAVPTEPQHPIEDVLPDYQPPVEEDPPVDTPTPRKRNR